MTSKLRQKGNRTRLKAIRKLEETGWKVDVVEKTSKYAENKDLFGLFDLIAIQLGTIKLIQVSTNKNKPHQAYIDFNHNYGNDNLAIEQWTYKDRQGFTIKEYGRQ